MEKTTADLRKIQSVASKLALSGPLSLGRVARDLGISPRSLQRELALKDTTFRQIVDAVRFDVARTLLTRTDFPVQAIAAKVGYRTPGSFARAFCRWTGQSPRAYRRDASPVSM